MFQSANAGTVSSVIERMTKRLESDPELRKRLSVGYPGHKSTTPKRKGDSSFYVEK